MNRFELAYEDYQGLDYERKILLGLFLMSANLVVFILGGVVVSAVSETVALLMIIIAFTPVLLVFLGIFLYAVNESLAYWKSLNSRIKGSDV